MNGFTRPSASFPRKRESSVSDSERMTREARGCSPLDSRFRGNDVFFIFNTSGFKVDAGAVHP